MKISVREEIGQYELPDSVDEFIQGLEDRITATGQPRENVSISIQSGAGYDTDYGYIELSYSREETPQEKTIRENREKQSEMYERQHLARLKAKYEWKELTIRCNICDKELSAQEINFNKDIGTFDPCSVCLDIALEAAFSEGYLRPDDVEIPEEIGEEFGDGVVETLDPDVWTYH